MSNKELTDEELRLFLQNMQEYLEKIQVWNKLKQDPKDSTKK